MIRPMRLRVVTLAFLVPGLLFFLIGIASGSGVAWIGIALLGVASLLALWIKWGPTGWGWETRRGRRR